MMKFALALLATVTVTTSVRAMACPEGEAQFAGRVYNTFTIQHDKAECVYQIEFARFDVNPSCPIDQGQAEMTQFRDASCMLKEGDTVSGYMIEKAGSSLSIERR